MSISAALGSTIFIRYVCLVGMMLVVAAAALATLKWGLRRNVTSAWQSLRGWLVMIPMVLAAIFLGRFATIAFFTLLALGGFWEYARATGLSARNDLSLVAYLGIAACGAASLVNDPTSGADGWYGLYMTLPVFVILSLLAVPIVRNRVHDELRPLALSIVGFVYVGWMFCHLAFLANSTNAYGYLLYVLLAVELNDVAAFTFGKALGRHPLRSNVSPKKTWEGSLGALAVSMTLPWLLGFSFPDFTVRDRILTGLIVGVGGQLGDLAISVIKRDCGIKDMGTLLRGHGGILDRIDSLIYVAPLYFHCIRYFHDVY